MKKFTTNKELLKFGGTIFKEFEKHQLYLLDGHEVLEELDVEGVLFKRNITNFEDDPRGIFCYEAEVDNVNIDVWYYKDTVLSEVFLRPTEEHGSLTNIAHVHMKKDNFKKHMNYLIELEYSHWE
ncbi:hypothetical protein PDK24_09490 [Bacillus cereus]|nr:hypothetical protein [Bacillus cereus]